MFLSIWILILTFAIYIFHDVKKPKKFPKGPSWIPVLGSAIPISKARKATGMLVKGVRKISEEMNISDLIGFKVGKDRVVFVYSTEAIMEMFTNQDIDGRPFGPFYETRTWNQRLGIVLTDGGEYCVLKIFRKFSHHQSISFLFRLLVDTT
jgi:methyl farnesoate epoxidase / farnesoate epoxidase